MRSPLFLIIPALALAAPPPPETGIEQLPANSFRFDWDGAPERTFFIQGSLDLETWMYFPLIEHGSTHPPFDHNNSSPRYFLRLAHVDIPTGDPESADFDLDGLGNLAELGLTTDPLHADTDRDGVPDGIETAASSDPLDPADGDPAFAIDTDGDGLSDAVETLAGTSPTLRDTDGDGTEDGADAFPLDPARAVATADDPADTVAPLVTLESPSNAVLLSGP